MGNSCSGICRKKAAEVKSRKITPVTTQPRTVHESDPITGDRQPETVEQQLNHFLSHGRQIPGHSKPNHVKHETLGRVGHHPHHSNAISPTRLSAEIAETQKRSHRNSEHPGRFLSGTDLVEDRERPSSAPKSPSTTNETTINKHRS